MLPSCHCETQVKIKWKLSNACEMGPRVLVSGQISTQHQNSTQWSPDWSCILDGESRTELILWSPNSGPRVSLSESWILDSRIMELLESRIHDSDTLEWDLGMDNIQYWWYWQRVWVRQRTKIRILSSCVYSSYLFLAKSVLNFPICFV